MKLLVVDDSTKMRTLLISIVKPYFDEIEECADGGEALACYAAFRPDWVLMDIEMKNIDGITATRTIKEKFPEARIIVVTAVGNSRLRTKALQAGAMDYVLKENVFDLPQTFRIKSGGLRAFTK